MKTKKYRIVIELESEEPIEDVDSILEGSWLYDEDFRGAIIKEELKELK